ncbi:MAG: J domain-containing protein [Dichotomicrobium sp.]
MKLDSPIFDRIRVKPARQTHDPQAERCCEWPGCTRPGPHRAPMGRGREGQYFHYCKEHVRLYNKQYNYFRGMSDEEIASFQQSAVTGHRPTWNVGSGANARHGFNRRQHDWRAFAYAFDTSDPFGLFEEDGAGVGPASERERRLHNAERKSLRVLGLDDEASASDIRTQFKNLVMTLHPDQNGGDRSSEDKLREVIQAYNYLKKSGLC